MVILVQTASTPSAAPLRRNQGSLRLGAFPNRLTKTLGAHHYLRITRVPPPSPSHSLVRAPKTRTRGSSVLLRSYGVGGGHGMNAMSTYRGERFVQAVENVIDADDVAQAVAVKVGP